MQLQYIIFHLVENDLVVVLKKLKNFHRFKKVVFTDFKKCCIISVINFWEHFIFCQVLEQLFTVKSENIVINCKRCNI